LLSRIRKTKENLVIQKKTIVLYGFYLFYSVFLEGESNLLNSR